MNGLNGGLRIACEGKIMGILTKKGAAAGTVAGLVISILHSQTFRSDLFDWYRLIAWYLVSLLVGCAAGFLAGRLVSRLPARLSTPAAYVGGALFGILAYFIQVTLFLIYVFRTTNWE